jgi:V8-like Glu-specific endopeptidase
MVDSSAVPTAILPALTEVQKSVAFIRCGNVTGTGFLLAKDKLITCDHVHSQMVAQRHPDAKILVHFDYGDPQQRQILQAEVDEEKAPIYGKNLDYIIYWMKYIPADLKPLGHLVRSSFPCSGPVILIGHPESKIKVFEVCPIKERWVETLVERATDAHEYCQQHPQECKLSNENKSCVHTYENLAVEMAHQHQLAYDTNFLEGSSGSPVLNIDGHIVAMHTRGYPFPQGSKRVSLMEFGTTFAAIYQDVKDRYSVWLANCLFPDINST